MPQMEPGTLNFQSINNYNYDPLVANTNNKENLFDVNNIYNGNTGIYFNLENSSNCINFNQNNKHLIQTVPGANHGWAGLSSGNLDNIRHNIIYG